MGGEVTITYNPATEEPLAEVAKGSPEDADRAIEIERSLDKDAVLAHNASSLFRIAPYLIFGCMVLAASIVPVVGLGVPGSATGFGNAVFLNTVSASAARRPTSMVCQADLAFQMLFGGVAEGNASEAV